MLAVLLIAQNAATGADSPAQAAPQGISYAGGQLAIDMLDSTLADVLAKVAALTGVKIDVPAGASSERMPVIKLGPGPARQILVSLLSESNFDYLIQASDTDAEKIQSVLLMPREKGGSGTNGMEAAARPSRNPYMRAVAPSASPEQAAVSETPLPSPPENAAAEASPSPPPSAASPTQPAQSGLPRPGALAPPAVMNQQTINQQLQQMYQERMQMNRQSAQAAAANPGSK